MTLSYVGNRENNKIGGSCRGKRFAEFTYTDKEEERFFKIVECLEMQGYNIDTGVMNWAVCEVENKAEFDSVKEAFQKAKKIIK